MDYVTGGYDLTLAISFTCLLPCKPPYSLSLYTEQVKGKRVE